MTASSPTTPPTHELRGRVERLTYIDPKTRYTVARVAPEGETYLVSVSGNLADADVGADVLLRGRWIVHPTHGRQFESQTCQILSPGLSVLAERGAYFNNCLDVLMGIYDDAPLIVDYYSNGTIGTAPALAELCAVVNFHPRYGLPPFPLGILQVEQSGGFLRAKKRVFHCVGGAGTLPMQPIESQAEARIRMAVLALTIGADILKGNPQLVRLISAQQPFSPGYSGYQARFYGEPFEQPEGGEITSGEVHVVLHLENDKYPSAAIIVVDRSQDPNPHYLTAIMSEEGDVEYLRQLATHHDALTHATTSTALVAGALHAKASAASLHDMFTKWGKPVPPTVAGAPTVTLQQAQAQYDYMINIVKSGLIS